jgi:hypothetical protein
VSPPRRRFASAAPSGLRQHIGISPKLLSDFILFSQRQYDCLDYDPFHPMLAHLTARLPREAALWYSTLYMAFYNIGSAYVAFRNSDPLKPLPAWTDKLPVGVQRRNLRGGLVRKHLEDFSRRAQGSIHGFLTQGFSGAALKDWSTMQDTLQSVWGNGRWGAYTLGELYQKVNKVPVLPSDIMNDGSSGPRHGLCYMYGIEPHRDVAELDQLATQMFETVRPQIRTKIFYLPTGHYDFGMLESQLCDFNSMRHGRYYIGRDIDRDQERIVKAEVACRALGFKANMFEVWDARTKVFDKRFLGEHSGWSGRTDYAKTFYQKTGLVADHMTIREKMGVLF